MKNKFRKTFLVSLLAFLLVLALSVASAFCSNDRQQITVILRYDDYSSSSPTKLEERIIAALKRNGISSTFAVIPFVSKGDWHAVGRSETASLGSEKFIVLQRAISSGTIEPALHGYTHNTIKTNKGDGYSEFASVPLQKQVQEIDLGKRYLEAGLNQKVSIFVPPWNSYDKNTLIALDKLGFKYISAAADGPVKQSGTLGYAPATADLSHAKQAIAAARNSIDPNPTVILIYHAYDFREYSPSKGTMTINNFNSLLSGLKNQKNINFSSIETAGRISSKLDLERMLSFKSYNNAQSLLPSIALQYIDPIINHESASVYFSSPASELYRSRAATTAAILYFLIVSISGVISMFISNKLLLHKPKVVPFYSYGLLILTTASMLLIFKDSAIGMKSAMSVTVSLGMASGSWFYICKSRSFQVIPLTVDSIEKNAA